MTSNINKHPYCIAINKILFSNLVFEGDKTEISFSVLLLFDLMNKQLIDFCFFQKATDDSYESDKLIAFLAGNKVPKGSNQEITLFHYENAPIFQSQEILAFAQEHAFPLCPLKDTKDERFFQKFYQTIKTNVRSKMHLFLGSDTKEKANLKDETFKKLAKRIPLDTFETFLTSVLEDLKGTEVRKGPKAGPLTEVRQDIGAPSLLRRDLRFAPSQKTEISEVADATFIKTPLEPARKITRKTTRKPIRKNDTDEVTKAITIEPHREPGDSKTAEVIDLTTMGALAPQEIQELEKMKSVIQKLYKGDWALFFLKWQKESNEHFQEVKEQNKELKGQVKELKEQNLGLHEQNRELHKKIDELVKSNLERQEKERIKQEELDLIQAQKDKRKSRKKLEPRAYVSYEEYKVCLDKPKDKEFFKDPTVIARIRVTLALLYVTGLRISNLLLFSKRNMMELLETGNTVIPIIKGGRKQALITIGAIGKKMLQEVKPDIDWIADFQEDKGGPFFFAKQNKKKTFDRSNFDSQCNKILEWASGHLGKYIRSHSFRASFVTDLLETNSMEETRDIVGHANINTTELYRRSNVPPHQQKRKIANMQRARISGKGPAGMDEDQEMIEGAKLTEDAEMTEDAKLTEDGLLLDNE